jgi:tight adherence protein B
MLLLSLALVASAAALGLGPVPRLRSVERAAGGVGGRRGAEPPGRRAGRARSRTAVMVAVACATLWTLSSAVTGTQLAVLVIGAGSALALARMVAVSRRAEEAARRRRSVVDFCEALVGELSAGQPVLAALERSVWVWPEAAPVLATARLDGDLPGALRGLSASPGAESLAHLAAAWRLCAATGGGLASAAGLVLDSARADAAALRQVEGEVSAARATARLVAVLPVVVLSAGEGLGARPWAFLVGRPAGVVCLGSGLALLLAGLAWIERIAVAATSGEG